MIIFGWRTLIDQATHFTEIPYMSIFGRKGDNFLELKRCASGKCHKTRGNHGNAKCGLCFTTTLDKNLQIDL